MECFVKDAKTFLAKVACCGTVVESELTFASIYDEVSQITIVGAKQVPEAGDFVVLDNGFFGVIQTVEPERDVLHLSCRVPLTMFERKLWQGDAPFTVNGYEQFLKAKIEAEFKNLQDIVYRLPFLEVTAETTTTGGITPTLDEGQWSVKGFALKLRRMEGIYLDFVPRRDKLEIKIRKRPEVEKRIIIPSTDYQLEDRSVSGESVGRVTMVCEGRIQDYYLLTNGKMTKTYTAANRVKGSWVLETCDEDPDTAALEIFLDNYYSHNITFRSKQKLDWGTKVQILVERQLYRSYISAVRMETDGVWTYQTGEMSTAYPPLRRL